MNYCKIKNNYIVCFSKDELSKLFEITKKLEIIREIIKQNFSFGDLQNNYSNMEELANFIGKQGAQNRDEHEIFAARFIFLDFFEDGSEICFKLKNNFYVSKNKIISFQDLNRLRDDPPDFIVRSRDGFRQFELKRYRDKLNTLEIFNFIEKKMTHYGNNLSDTNLLLMLQPHIDNNCIIDFHELHTRLEALKLKFQQEQILISYNENNLKRIIVQVYPKLTKSIIPFKFPFPNHKLYYEK